MRPADTAIRETGLGDVWVRWKCWKAARDEGGYDNLMWEVHGPTEQAVVRLARRMGKAMPDAHAGKPREEYPGWMILGIYQAKSADVTEVLEWLEALREVLDGR